MNKRIPAVVGLVMGLILLGGCAAKAAPSFPEQAGAQGSGSSLVSSPESAESVAAPPPAAAAMVCSTEAKDSVTKILGLAATPATTPSWNGSTYSCSYKLTDGPFTMSVEVTKSDAAATAAAKTLAGSLSAAPIQGLSNLGLPGYQSAQGAIVFAKDNMVLHVDATTMAATVGQNHVARTDFAYQIATTILACWSEH